jgi:hypothetical protein
MSPFGGPAYFRFRYNSALRERKRHLAFLLLLVVFTSKFLEAVTVGE